MPALSPCPTAPLLQAPRCHGVPRHTRAALLVSKARPRRSISVRLQAVRAWPDPDFIAETKAAFPEQGVASVEEARVLFSSAGYTFLDVRSELEVEDVGRVRASVNIPYVFAKGVWDAEQQQHVVVLEPNPDWIRVVKRRFPRDAPLLVCCTDGKEYSIDALIALDEAGYTNIVGVRGGYEAWCQVFDNQLMRKKPLATAAPADPEIVERALERMAEARPEDSLAFQSKAKEFEIQMLSERIESLEWENAELQEKIRSLQNDPSRSTNGRAGGQQGPGGGGLQPQVDPRVEEEMRRRMLIMAGDVEACRTCGAEELEEILQGMVNSLTNAEVAVKRLRQRVAERYMEEGQAQHHPEATHSFAYN